jgi:hypothetical protein
MDPTLMVALVLIGAALLMFIVALPRRGEPVGFLRNRDWLQSAYAMIFVGLLVTGVAVGTDYLR